jgi:hypothetical protein
MRYCMDKGEPSRMKVIKTATIPSSIKGYFSRPGGTEIG